MAGGKQTGAESEEALESTGEEAPDQAADEEKSASGKGRPKLPLVVAMYVSVVFVASAATQFLVIPKVSPILAARQLEEEKEVTAEMVRPPFGEIYVIEDLVVNPANSGGMRYVAASVGLESSQRAVIQEIETRDAQIKDALIRILSSKTVEELADVTRREAIRLEIRKCVDELLRTQGVDAVYFVSFVLQ